MHAQRERKRRRNRQSAIESRARKRVTRDLLEKAIVAFGGKHALPSRKDKVTPPLHHHHTHTQQQQQQQHNGGDGDDDKEKRRVANKRHARAYRQRNNRYDEKLLSVASEIVPPNDELWTTLASKETNIRASRKPPLFMQLGPDGGRDGQQPLPPSMSWWDGCDDAELLFNAKHEDMDLWFLAAPPTTTASTTTTTKVVVEVDALGRELELA